MYHQGNSHYCVTTKKETDFLIKRLKKVVIDFSQFCPTAIKSEKLDEMISNEDLRQHIAKESIRLAKTTFNIETINSQISDIYRELSQ